ncbi:S-adenosyl-L-methionine-dependent methyltransferase [Phakopsora pachyrhizi]|uniref:S-adenosyl-L-methionine-dependent methyltransferase n=1 Tax=Phakopsora pachyrhizi TaxID=170000 RepID=A0AAV0BGM4_PHAPC|nr:S-adenosyl-L-methionine-dependent methyltransferase [Phakopsora pachyrhizi]
MGKSKRNKRSSRDGGEATSKRSNQRWESLPETNLLFVEYYKDIQQIFNKSKQGDRGSLREQRVEEISNPSEVENHDEKAQEVNDDSVEKEDGDVIRRVEMKCHDEDEEWKLFFKSLRTDLPTTFRITGGKNNSEHLNHIIENKFIPILSKISINDQAIQPPKKLPWYPDGLAWELSTSKQMIKKSIEFKEFQNFLVYETEAGNISRQEAVSMIPPLLLDVQPHHFVLDTCAAPGSKTAQLVEFIHQSSSDIPEGLLIANDSDYKRSHLLVHQSLRRLPSPSTMITNHDATRFPCLSLGDNSKLLFDRILCDVPCSGDGTLRKNGGIWRDWNPSNGIGLHGLQLRIISRAISLLKPGGRLVYSTCSLNPIENEAVVSAALNRFPSMRLLDVSDRLPELRRRPGMLNWKVARKISDRFEILNKESSLKKELDPKKYPLSLWPSSNEKELGLDRCLRIYPHLQDTGGFFVSVLQKEDLDEKPKWDNQSKNIQASEKVFESDFTEPERKRQKVEDHGNLNGSHQIALLTGAEATHSNNEGQFDKLKEEAEVNDTNGSGSKEVSATEKEEADTIQSIENSQPIRGFKEDPYVYLKPDNEEINICLDFFGISSEFPTDNLLVRNPEGVPNRTIYLTSSIVRRVIENNLHDRLRLVCCGVKMFGRQDQYKNLPISEQNRCKWRLISDGIEFLKRFIGTKRLVTCGLDGLKQLISFQQKHIQQKDKEEEEEEEEEEHDDEKKKKEEEERRREEQYPLFEDVEDEQFREQVRILESGSCLLKVEGEGVPRDLMVGLWISKASINLMVDKKERRVLSLRLWGEDLTRS